MSIRDLFSRKKSSVEQRQFFPYITQYYNSGLFQVEKNAAVDRAVSLLSNTIGTLPLRLYQWTSKGIREDWSSPTARLMADPCVEETSQMFYQNIVRFMALTGNCFIFKHRYNGQVVALELVDPKTVIVSRSMDGRKRYTITGEAGGVYTDYEIIHITYNGEGYNGTLGMSPVQAHRDIVQQNDILQEFISLTFNRGIGSRLLVTLDKDQFKSGAKLNQLVMELSEYMQKFVYGRENSGKPIITPPSTTISTIDLPDMIKANVESLYSITCDQVYQLFNIPPEVINSKEQKYASLEMKYQDYLRLAVLPLCNHIAQTLSKALIPAEDRNIFFFKFNFDGLLETDYNKKVDSLIKEFHAGIITLNEARRRLDMENVDDNVAGDTRWIPANLVPLNEENINAYLAKSKLALGEGQASATSMEDKNNNQNVIGDDKI